MSVFPLKWYDVTQTALTVLHVSTELVVSSRSTTFHFLIVFVSLRRSADINSNVFIIISSSSVINQTTTCSDHAEVCGCRTPIWCPISLTTHEQLLYKNQNYTDEEHKTSQTEHYAISGPRARYL